MKISKTTDKSPQSLLNLNYQIILRIKPNDSEN
jgi:hypothetical protein